MVRKCLGPYAKPKKKDKKKKGGKKKKKWTECNHKGGLYSTGHHSHALCVYDWSVLSIISVAAQVI